MKKFLKIISLPLSVKVWVAKAVKSTVMLKKTRHNV